MILQKHPSKSGFETTTNILTMKNTEKSQNYENICGSKKTSHRQYIWTSFNHLLHWNISWAVPIHKKDPKLECSNYRSISILSNIDKILDRLMKFLTEQEIFYLQQFGFRKNFSTAHAIMNLIDSIKNVLDKSKFVCSVFVDLKKVDHEILLKKLCHYGIRASDWFKSYLTNNAIHFNQWNLIWPTESQFWSSARLSPWSSALPFVHKWFTQFIRFSSPFLFVNDTGFPNILYSIRAINKTLHKDLGELSFWLNASKISLNIAKTEILLF